MSAPLSLDAARAMDAADPLRGFRERFCIPEQNGKPWHYFCNHSLGLMPLTAPGAIEKMIDRWRVMAVRGHFVGDDAWVTYHEKAREPLAQLLGAKPTEVTAMNALSVNLHVLMASFYKPQGKRRKLVIEKGAFPSDRFAVRAQIQWHGLDPDAELVEIEPPAGETVHGLDGLREYLEQHGDEVALVMWPGVQYVTGESFDLGEITRLCHEVGAIAGFDLAHRAGNAPVALHDEGADFAAWCSYKYLNSGPGAVAGIFVHERHHGRDDLVKLCGWWANDISTRFRMGPDLEPAPGAEAWQASNAAIFSLAPVLESLAIFNEAGMDNLREKSLRLTGFMEALIHDLLDDEIEIITPSNPQRRGCMLCLRVRRNPEASKAVNEALTAGGVIGDWRSPDVMRFAPVPLYNTFEDVWHGMTRLQQELHAHR